MCKLQPSKLSFFLLPLFLLTSAANAVIIEGNLKAKITSVSDISGEQSAFGNPALDTEISATFWYDTALLKGGPVFDDLPNIASYGGTNNAIVVNYTIGNKIFSLADIPTGSTIHSQRDVIDIQYNDERYWWDILDMFVIEESLYAVGDDSVAGNRNEHRREGRITLWPNTEHVNLEQQFSLLPGDDYFSFGSLGLLSKGYRNGISFYESLDAEITEFTMKPRSARVTEPSGFFLASLGFLLLGWRVYPALCGVKRAAQCIT
jgi:hypothetical protein